MSRGRRLPKVLTEEEQARLLAQFNTRYKSSHRNRVLIRLALATGLRVGEIVALTVDHLRLDREGGRIVVREGKGVKDRVVWFGPGIRQALTRWLKRREEAYPETSVLFPTRTGKPIQTSYVRKIVGRAAREAGLKEAERVSPHTLRHTFATELLRQTGNLRIVQSALGHARISTTELYTHLVNDEVEEAMRRRSVG